MIANTHHSTAAVTHNPGITTGSQISKGTKDHIDNHNANQKKVISNPRSLVEPQVMQEPDTSYEDNEDKNKKDGKEEEEEQEWKPVAEKLHFHSKLPHQLDQGGGSPCRICPAAKRSKCMYSFSNSQQMGTTTTTPLLNTSYAFTKPHMNL